VTNQLRAHLRIVFPGVVGLFAHLDSAISLEFPARFERQDRADWLLVKRLAAWLASVGYSGRNDPSMLYRRLTSAPHDTARTDGTATTGAFAAVLSSLAAHIMALDADTSEQFACHADTQIFTSLPRAGTFRVACLTGVAPSIQQPGTVKHVGSRWAVDKQLSEAVTDFARAGRHADPCAADVYNRAIARVHDHPHAICVFPAWLYVIWHCWQDGTDYDPAKHWALQTLLNQAQHWAA